ncbi:MAG: hypothetical protein EAX96_08030 [Candidatus Lokiarchaeota archaeon]|nr:hypothetical protein [Candidatus Lokiarchaeota archaeon]
MTNEKSAVIMKGKDFTNEAKDKDKWKTIEDMYHKKVFTIFAFLKEKNIDFNEFFDFQKEMYEKLNPYNNSILQATVKSLPKNFILQQFTKNIVSNWQAFQNLKNMSVQFGEKYAILEIKKCSFRKNIKKNAKKLKMNNDISELATCQFCKMTFSQGQDFGFTTEITETSDGCIIKSRAT